MTNAQRIVEGLEDEVGRLRDERATLFAEVERLRGVVQAARTRAEGIRAALNVGQLGAAALGVFGLLDDLAALEGKE